MFTPDAARHSASGPAPRAAAAVLGAMLAAAALVPGAARAQVTERNITLEAHLNEYPDPAPGYPYAYSACWSYIHGDGREYAILGTGTGTAIYNVTNPSLTYRVGFIPGPNSIWREMKAYRNWIYIVTEGTGFAEGLQIVRMTDPEHPVLAASYTTGFTHSHTVSVDTSRALLFCNGTRDGSGQARGMHILSLASPEAPVELARWPAGTDVVSSAQYVHDCYPVGNRLYVASIYVGTERVLDITNPAAPIEIANWTYPGAYYTHSSWPDPTQHWLYVTDEQNGQTLHVFDIANLGSPTLVNSFTSNPAAIVHNPRVKGNALYLANYTEGVRILDLTDPVHPAEWAWADSYPGVSGGYGGVWDVCPFFPSGTIIASDMETGLYVYSTQPNYGLLRANVVDALAQPAQGQLVTLVSQGDSLLTPADGIVQFAPSPGAHTVRARRFGYYDAQATRTVSAGSRDTVTLALMPRPTGGVSGTVRDAQTSAPLGDAEVTLDYTPVRKNTDALGQYDLGQVPADLYRVEVRRAGYVGSVGFYTLGTGTMVRDWALQPATTWNDLESAAGWTIGAPGDNATSGIWTDVAPLGTGPQPPPPEAARAASILPQSRASRPMSALPCGTGSAAAALTALTASVLPPPGASCTCGTGSTAAHRADGSSDQCSCGCAGNVVSVSWGNAQPYADHSPAPGTKCFVTGQGTNSNDPDNGDVDGGITTLTSPTLDLASMAQPTIGYWRWFYSWAPPTGQPDPADWLAVLISNDNGTTWVTVDTTRGEENHWKERAITVSDLVTPTAQVRLRFVAADLGDFSIVEAAVDDITTWDAAAVVGVPQGAARPLRFRAPSPNPARGAVALVLDLPGPGSAEVEVLDPAGRRVRTIYRGQAPGGPLQLRWDGADDQGRPAAAGLYFARARTAHGEARTRFARLR